jgi:ribosome-associated heat shock protein Hsp15
VTGSSEIGSPGTLRLDKWLWHARFFKTRSIATHFCQSGRLRVNGEPTGKAHYAARIGDVLTFPIGTDVRVIKILDLGVRRGPAPEAQTLYEDLAPPAPRGAAKEPSTTAAERDAGSGRPTKSERRAIDRLMDRG